MNERNNDEREKFEAWAKPRGLHFYRLSDQGFGSYYAATDTQICWLAWRARATLCAPHADPVARTGDESDRLLHAVFEVCEETENIDPKNEFERGRVFEAKHIRRGVGTWFQDAFCGRSFMGEPVIDAAPVPPAPTMTDRDRELLREIRVNFESGMSDSWQNEAKALLLRLENSPASAAQPGVMQQWREEAQ